MSGPAPLRVLHVMDSGGLYGAESVLLELMTEQHGQGTPPLLCSVGKLGVEDKPVEQAAERQGLSVHRLRMTPGPNPSGALRIRRLALEWRADILHTHGYKGNILLGFLPRRRRAAPLPTTLHGYTHMGGLKRMALYQWLDRRALARMDCVVPDHAGMLDDPRLPRLRDERGCVIENGILPRAAAPPPDDEITRFCRSGFTIGFVGRPAAEKGAARLLDAVARPARDGVGARLAILGDGP